MLTEDTIFTASQDLSMKAIEKSNYDIRNKISKCHRKMFKIVGVYINEIITTSPPCKETIIWNINDFSISRKYDISSWNMIIDSNRLIFDDSNGIRMIEI